MFGKDRGIEELHQQLHITEPQAPGFVQIDAGLWTACAHTVRHPRFEGKEIAFINLGPELSRQLKGCGEDAIEALCGTGSCSFFPLVTARQICSTFDLGEQCKDLEYDYQSHYHRMRFAMNYWMSVRDMAAYSKSICVNYFCLDYSIVSMIANASPANVLNFCNAHPQLHQFVLTCPVEDCLNIIRIQHDRSLNGRSKEFELIDARIRKEHHSTLFAIEHAGGSRCSQ